MVYKGILSCWVRLDGGDGADRKIWQSNGNRLLVQRDSLDEFDVLASNAAGTIILRLQSATNYTSREDPWRPTRPARPGRSQGLSCARRAGNY